VSVYGWDGEPATVVLPKGVVTAQGAATDLTTASAPFSVPKAAHAMTVYFPTNSTTFAIQGLVKPRDDQEAEVWRTISVAVGVTLTALSGITASAIAVTWPTSVIGGGVLRFLAAADQSAAPLTLQVVFHMVP
jgi:hypothetical protein